MEKNVAEILGRISEEVGDFEKEHFEGKMIEEIHNWEIDSPIEQVLLFALYAVRRFHFLEPFEIRDQDGNIYRGGVSIQPQKDIGNYRVDFEVIRGWLEHGQQEYFSVFVECDSQQFHERSEKERRYEKQRDRYLIAKGHRVLHYTGKEILDDPRKVGAEILSVVTGRELSGSWE